MSRREQIQMSPEEVRAFLDEERTVTCATTGPRGWPHLMPLWFVRREDELWAWTFGKSQKIVNVRRDPRATLQVEAGLQYQELRGVMLECEVVLHEDADVITGVGLEVLARYAPEGSGPPGPEAEAFVRKQAEKRIAMQFVERRRASWDHRKLGGTY